MSYGVRDAHRRAASVLRVKRPDDQLSVEQVGIAATYPLRRQVLRAGGPIESVRLPVDDQPTTAAFAARDAEGKIVGTAIVYPEACPWQPGRAHTWRLRGMATAPELRGRGIGTRVLRAVLDHVTRAGGQLVWCNARTPARRFYEREGFVVHGDEWVDPEIGPHVAMSRELGRPGDTGNADAHQTGDVAPTGAA